MCCSSVETIDDLDVSNTEELVMTGMDELDAPSEEDVVTRQLRCCGRLLPLLTCGEGGKIQLDLEIPEETGSSLHVSVPILRKSIVKFTGWNIRYRRLS